MRQNIYNVQYRFNQFDRPKTVQQHCPLHCPTDLPSFEGRDLKGQSSTWSMPKTQTSKGYEYGMNNVLIRMLWILTFLVVRESKSLV